jgi:hypothetical protein
MNQSPDPRTVVVTFRLTPGERDSLDRKRGKRSIADYLRGLIFGGGK